MGQEKKSFWEKDSWLSEDDSIASGENIAQERGKKQSFGEQFRNEINSFSGEAGEKLGGWLTEGINEWLEGEQDLHDELRETVTEEEKPGFIKRSLSRILSVGMKYVEEETKTQAEKGR
jgi:hypothetical protein